VCCQKTSYDQQQEYKTEYRNDTFGKTPLTVETSHRIILIDPLMINASLACLHSLELGLNQSSEKKN
jgi:hypothetical protein